MTGVTREPGPRVDRRDGGIRPAGYWAEQALAPYWAAPGVHRAPPHIPSPGGTRRLRELRRFTDAGKPVAAVCHGPAALLPARGDDGAWLFRGREVTGFSNVEEHAVGTAPPAKWLVEDRLRAERGRYSRAPEDWAECVVVDGNLYTGQNPSSARALAERLVQDTARS